MRPAERERERVTSRKIRLLGLGLIAVSIIAVSSVIFSFLRPVGADPAPGTCLPISKGGTGCDKTALLQYLGDELYPVGTILITTINTNPSTKFGGTWVAWGTGRTIVGVDTNKTIFDTPEKTYGNYNLIVPYHRHTVNSAYFGSSTMFPPGTYSGVFQSPGAMMYTGYEGTSGNEVNANIQPSIAVYMWKRTN